MRDHFVNLGLFALCLAFVVALLGLQELESRDRCAAIAATTRYQWGKGCEVLRDGEWVQLRLSVQHNGEK